MKHKVLFALILAPGLALAQAPAAKPAPEAPKPAAAPAAVTAEAPKPAAKKSRRNEDARHCLEKADNTAIIKCAEEYL